MKTCPNCKELVGDSASKCFNCGWNFEDPSENEKVIEREKKRKEQEVELNKKKQEWREKDRLRELEQQKQKIEQAKADAARKEKERKEAILNQQIRKETIQSQQRDEEHLAKINNIYEYKVFTVKDTYNGTSNISEIQRILSTYAINGWRLHTIYTNELGKNASSLSIGGTSGGTNATIDQTIIILERLVIKAKE